MSTPRVTKQLLKSMFSTIVKKNMLPCIIGHTWVLDDYAPPDNKYRYTIVLREDKSGAEHQFYCERFSAQEMRALLKGIIMSYDVAHHFVEVLG